MTGEEYDGAFVTVIFLSGDFYGMFGSPASLRPPTLSKKITLHAGLPFVAVRFFPTEMNSLSYRAAKIVPILRARSSVPV